jgi:cystathionine beta-lyase/cystathionine gamma-synthase
MDEKKNLPDGSSKGVGTPEESATERVHSHVARLRDRVLDPKEAQYAERTHLIHGRAQTVKWDYKHHVVPPLSSSVTYRLDSSQRGAQGFIDYGSDHVESKPPIYIYDRLDEPTRGMLEENLAYACGGETAVCFASGMAAIAAAAMSLTRAGQEIVYHHVLYGCTFSLVHNWLPRFGIKTVAIDMNDLGLLEKAINPATRVVYFESPVNPDLHLIDISAVREVVERINRDRSPEDRVWVVVDNTFCTPFCQRPLSLGADVVVASLTKNVGGFGTDLGGVVVGPASLARDLLGFRKDFGGVMSPKSAWPILVYGLPTLPIRIRQQQETALTVARFLEADPRVERVLYPGLHSFPQRDLARRQMVDYEGSFAPGHMIYFILKTASNEDHLGGTFIDLVAENSYSITMAVSLGQIKTLIEHPFSMTHSALSARVESSHLVDPGGVRLSIGLESAQDIMHDLTEALNATYGPDWGR